MNDQEKSQFEQETYYREALQLRRWDDLAKDPAMQMLDIDDFTESLQQALISE
jgi:predicted HD phosphohydrolase